MAGFFKALRFNLSWGLPLFWSVKMAWRQRSGVSPKLQAARAYYERLAYLADRRAGGPEIEVSLKDL